MSQKKTPTFCIVVDCSIAQAAGSVESEHPRGIRCREFLMALRGRNHRIAWSTRIAEEWNEHRSRFAMDWLFAMQRLGNVRRVQSSLQLAESIDETELDRDVKADLIKDSHLVEAALETDDRISSLDDRVRVHFADLSGLVQAIGEILWANPVNQNEDATLWLEDGAPDQPKRLLKNFSRH